MSFQNILQQIEEGARDLMLTRYVSIAALTWLIYDHVLTFEKERMWIWSNKVTLTKVLFLINRYSAPIVMFIEIIQFSGRLELSNDMCVIWLLFEALWQSLSALIAQFLLGLRMCAIWGSRPWTKTVLYLGCLICSGASLTSIAVALARVSRSYQYFPEFRICYTPEPLSSWLWAAFFLPIMVFDVIIFVLTVWNVLVGRTERIRRGSLVAMMWRDGAIYFVLIFSSELACVIISALWGFNKTMIIKFLVWSIQNVVIGHMTLNLVEAVRRPEMEMLPTTVLNPSNRDLGGRPSTSTNRRSRRSGLPESIIEFNSNPGSPAQSPRLLSEKPRTRSAAGTKFTSSQGTHPYAFTQSSTMGDSNASLAAEKGWNEQEPVATHWAETYSSGKGERIRAVAGPSRRVIAIESSLVLEDSDTDGAVMSIGTGKSRLLTSSDTRPSILSRDDILTFKMEPSPAVTLSRSGTRRSDVDPLAIPSISRANSGNSAGFAGGRQLLGIAAQQVGDALDRDAESKKRRITQLVEALTVPQTNAIGFDGHSSTRSGLI